MRTRCRVGFNSSLSTREAVKVLSMMRLEMEEEIVDDTLRKALLDCIKSIHLNQLIRSKLEILQRISLTDWIGGVETSSRFRVAIGNTMEDHRVTLIETEAEAEAFKCIFNTRKIGRMEVLFSGYFNAWKSRAFKRKSLHSS